MKKTIFSRSFRKGLLLASFILSVSACEEKQAGDVPPQPAGGQVTPVGEVQGIAVITVIGTSGGMLESADGRLRVSIPAGAVAKNTTFSIQPVSNTNVAGLGQAYRLLPHDTPFSKPITLSFLYDREEWEGGLPEAIGVAYQDTRGIWQGSGAIHDTAAGTVSVSTTHFSDWSLFSSFVLTPVSASVEPGKTLTLSVINFMSDDELIPPVPGVKKPIGPQHSVAAQYIKEWKLAGEGTLKANGKEAVYTAPAAIPAKNPVAVSVSLKGPGNSLYLLVSNIYIGADGITFRINDGPWLHGTIPLGGVVAAAGMQHLDAAVEPLSTGGTYGALSLKWTGYPSGGYVSWGETMPWFNYSPSGGNISYQQYLVTGNKVIPSPGGITFTRYSETPGGDITGSFILERAGKLTNTGTSISWTPVKIEGFFKVKRSKL